MLRGSEFLLLLPVLIFSIVIHEVAHAWVARREGDDTADRLGRITLNPLVHLDPMGSFVVPALLFFSGTGIILGWAKPVPVDPRRFKDPVWSDIRVSMAGIVSNLILAAISFGLVVVFAQLPSGPGALSGVLSSVRFMAEFGVVINLVLAIFNLIPVPPLDGSHVVFHLLPRGIRRQYQAFGRFGILALLAVFVFVPQVGGLIFLPIQLVLGAAYGLAGL